MNIQVNGSAIVLGDEMALTMVFRNLFENTNRHNPQSNGVVVDLKNFGSEVICYYNDQGKPFLGSRKKLGELFYKHDSKKGTGIGLYLVKQLLKAQHGKLEFSPNGPLVFHLHFQRGEE